MADPLFTGTVTSEAQLRQRKGEPHARSRLKQKDRLNEGCRAFIASSPFLVLGTASASGQCDVSPKGDAPGFVRVIDDTHLAIPDRVGNNRLDGMLNILENPHVGMIFFIPGRDDTLRVNGKAQVVEDTALLDSMAVDGKRPDFAIAVEVEQAFVHCPKAFRRARLWQTDAWPSPDVAPSMAQILWDQLPAGASGAESCEAFEEAMEERAKTLY
jgi:PPOX class probable FMN-dependent enzyme